MSHNRRGSQEIARLFFESVARKSENKAPFQWLAIVFHFYACLVSIVAYILLINYSII